MALTDSDLSELLAALKAGEMTDTIRSSLEWILQQLIEAEATAVIGAGPHERTEAQRDRSPLWSRYPAAPHELCPARSRTDSTPKQGQEHRDRLQATAAMRAEPAFGDGASDDDAVQDGDRMLIRCNGGPSISRLVRYPPPLEIEERGGVYVLVDDGPPELWRYEFIRPAL